VIEQEQGTFQKIRLPSSVNRFSSDAASRFPNLSRSEKISIGGPPLCLHDILVSPFMGVRFAFGLLMSNSDNNWSKTPLAPGHPPRILVPVAMKERFG
jgi:hypothetical protein